MPLGMLAAGQLAVVTDLVGAAEQVHRLEELGIRRGCQVEMPLHCPAVGQQTMHP